MEKCRSECLTWQQAVPRWAGCYVKSIVWESRDWLDSLAVDYSRSGWTRAERAQFDEEWDEAAVDWGRIKEFGERNPAGIRWHAGALVVEPDIAYLTDESGRVGDRIFLRSWSSSELLMDEHRSKVFTVRDWGPVAWFPGADAADRRCLKKPLGMEPCPWLVYVN